MRRGPNENIGLGFTSHDCDRALATAGGDIKVAARLLYKLGVIHAEERGASMLKAAGPVRPVGIASSNADIDISSHLDFELKGGIENVERYIAPNVETARLFWDQNHPRNIITRKARPSKMEKKLEEGRGINRSASNHRSFVDGNLITVNNEVSGYTKHSICGTKTGSYCCCGNSRSELERYGPGITNHFKLYKWLGCTMFLIGLINLPLILLNLYDVREEEFVIRDISDFTIGNLGQVVENGTLAIQDDVQRALIHELFCGNDSYLMSHISNMRGECSWNINELATLYVRVDVFCCMLFLFAYFLLKRGENLEEKQMDKTNIQVHNFAVRLDGIPLDTSASELKAYIEEHSDGGLVRSVDIAEDSAALIKLWTKRGRLLKRMAMAQSAIAFLLDVGGSRRDVNNAIRQRNNLLSQIRNVQREQEKLPRGNCAIRAYVVFRTSAGKRSIMNKFPKRRGNGCCRCPSFIRATCNCLIKIITFGIGCCRKKTVPRFRNEFKIRVSEPEDPSTIVWENLQHRWCKCFSRRGKDRGCLNRCMRDRATRRVISLVSSMLVVLVCVSLSFGLKYYQNSKLEDYTMDKYKCNDFNTNDHIKTMKEKLYNPVDLAPRMCTPDYTGSEESDEDIKQLECYCVRNFWTRCCVSFLDIEGIQNIFFIKYMLSILVSIFLAGSSIAIKKILHHLTYFEKHNTEGKRFRALSVRLFALNFLNTALVTLFMPISKFEGKAPENSSFIGKLMLRERFRQWGDDLFTVAWYRAQGPLLIYIALIFTVTPYASAFAWRCKRRWQLRKLVNSSVSPGGDLALFHQTQLNEAGLGPEFPIYYRLADLFTVIFLSLMYGAGLGLLYFISAMAVFFTYWADKYLFLRYYRIPPQYSIDIFRPLTSLLPWGLALHSVTSAYIYSGYQIFPYDSIEYFTGKEDANYESIVNAIQTNHQDGTFIGFHNAEDGNSLAGGKTFYEQCDAITKDYTSDFKDNLLTMKFILNIPRVVWNILAPRKFTSPLAAVFIGIIALKIIHINIKVLRAFWKRYCGCLDRFISSVLFCCADNEDAQTIRKRGDDVIIECSFCGTKNYVPAKKASLHVSCSNCGQTLPKLSVKYDEEKESKVDIDKKKLKQKKIRQGRLSVIVPGTDGKECLLELQGRLPGEPIWKFSIDSAVKAKRLIGLDGYHIMHNPTYQRKFNTYRLGKSRPQKLKKSATMRRTLSWMASSKRRAAGSNEDEQMTWQLLHTAQALIPGGDEMYAYIPDTRCCGCFNSSDSCYFCCL